MLPDAICIFISTPSCLWLSRADVLFFCVWCRAAQKLIWFGVIWPLFSVYPGDDGTKVILIILVFSFLYLRFLLCSNKDRPTLRISYDFLFCFVTQLLFYFIFLIYYPFFHDLIWQQMCRHYFQSNLSENTLHYSPDDRFSSALNCHEFCMKSSCVCQHDVMAVIFTSGTEAKVSVRQFWFSRAINPHFFTAFLPFFRFFFSCFLL